MQRREQIIEYFVNICEECGKEFRVLKEEKTKVCYECQANKLLETLEKEAKVLIGAEIIDFELFDCGLFSEEGQLESVKLRLKNGNICRLELGEYDEKHISWLVEEESEG